MKNLKTNNLYQITGVQTILVQRLYKNNYENIVYKNYNIRFVDVSIIWVLKFGTYFEFQSLKQRQKAWHYWLKNKMKIVLKEPK